jgi:hypothetical protein
MYVCHICGKDNTMKDGGWLDNYGKKPNPNEVDVSMGPGYVGLAYDTTGRNYSPAWGGQFQSGGFLQPISYKLPSRYRIPYAEPSTELATSIGGEKGEPAYLIPTFKGGKDLKDPVAEYKKTGEHLGGPFKTYQEAEKWEQEIRHPYVEKGKPIPTPLKRWGDMAMGGSLPGSVGFTYARVAGSAPSNGKYAKKTKASAQNGKEMKFYQEGFDFKPNSIAQDGEAIVDPMGQWAHPGEVTIIPGTDITMEGVDYPVLGISDTGDTQMMYPGEDYDFDGEYVTEYPMMQEGGWLSKYQEKAPSDATRVSAPVKVLTKKEQEENAKINKETQKRTEERNKQIIAERAAKRKTKGDVNVPGSFNLTEKLRLFPENVGGVGEMIDKYLNPGTVVGTLADSLGESIAARSPEGVAATLAMTTGAGALGFDPLSTMIKPAKSLDKYLTEKIALKNNYKSKLNPYSSVPGSRDLAINNILESPIDEYRNLDVFLLAKDTQKQVENEMIRRSGIENKALGEIEGSNLGVRRSSPISKYKFSNEPYNPFSEYGYGAYDEQALKQSYSDSFDDYVRWKQNMLKKLPKNKNGGWLNKYK